MRTWYYVIEDCVGEREIYSVGAKNSQVSIRPEGSENDCDTFYKTGGFKDYEEFAEYCEQHAKERAEEFNR